MYVCFLCLFLFLFLFLFFVLILCVFVLCHYARVLLKEMITCVDFVAILAHIYTLK